MSTSLTASYGHLGDEGKNEKGLLGVSISEQCPGEDELCRQIVDKPILQEGTWLASRHS